MMGAVLQAALMAVMELSHNPGIIRPTMLVIVIANITASHGFKTKSIFQTQMEMLGLQYKQNPLSKALSRASLGSQMSKRFIRVANLLSWRETQSYAEQDNVWLLVAKNHAAVFILRLENLKIYLASAQETSVDLTKIPGLRKDVTRILLQATLSKAFDKLQIPGVQALVIVRMSAPLIESPGGFSLVKTLRVFIAEHSLTTFLVIDGNLIELFYRIVSWQRHHY